MRELWQRDTFELCAMLGESEISPEDLLSLFLGRIDHLDAEVNAVVHLNETAMHDARESTERRRAGKPLSPLDGIPMLLKDNLVAEGMPTSWGSALFADKTCMRDEIPVQRLRDAGVVFMGKTNVPEFTVEGVTSNHIFGTTRNPWDTDKIPGGSSGGSVAAVALGMSPCSVGTDGGGSVRRPASYVDLVGLKTSIGQVPRGSGLPQLLLDMETVGPITRTVRDQALLLNVLVGPDRRDHRSLGFARTDFLKDLDRAPGTLRVLAVEQIGDAPVDPEILTSFRRMVDDMSKLGHRIETGALPLDVQPIYERWTTIADIGLGLLLKQMPEMAERASKKYVEWAQKSYPATHLLEILETLVAIRNQAAVAFDEIDIIMTPSSAALPWSTDIPFPPEIDGTPVGPRGSAPFSGWVNAIGHPGISLPGPRGASGLPIGVQFVADFGQDALLLRLSKQIENQFTWQDSWPSLALQEMST